MTIATSKVLSSDFLLELRTTRELCYAVDTPISLSVYLLCKYEEWDQIARFSIDSGDYQNVQHFADDYLVTSLLRKSVNLPLGIDRSAIATAAFFKAEDDCRRVNTRLRDPSQGHSQGFFEARRLLHSVLGRLRHADLVFCQERFRFGPGATTAIKGRGCVLSDKYDEEIHLTEELYPYYRQILGDTWWDALSRPVIVEGSKFTTVPKTALTERGICIEPTLNIYVQLGIGALTRQRLKTRLGIDLSNQADVNRELVARARADGLATIDLSAASDTISYELVKALLPWEWFVLFSTPRSETTSVDGETHRLEKFSSMGNGFTFELETLIFSSVAFSHVPTAEHHNVSVFGDDIIVPQAYARDVIETLNHFGFSVNREKSFLAGSFFESCGTDYFQDQPVRPFFLRRNKESQIPYALQVANRLRIYASQRMIGSGCDPKFRPAWRSLVKQVPRQWSQCRVPVSLGDSGLVVPLEEASTAISRPENGCEGWVVRHIILRPRQLRKKSLGRFLSALACPVTEVASLGREPRRGLFGKPAKKRVTAR